MNPLILRRNEDIPDKDSVLDPGQLAEVEARLHQVQQCVAANGHQLDGRIDELRTLIHSDVPALLARVRTYTRHQ